MSLKKNTLNIIKIENMFIMNEFQMRCFHISIFLWTDFCAHKKTRDFSTIFRNLYNNFHDPGSRVFSCLFSGCLLDLVMGVAVIIRLTKGSEIASFGSKFADDCWRFFLHKVEISKKIKVFELFYCHI